ncbi:hypothetical protein V8D89_012350 [Ganoderma adspersum]
MDVVTKHPPLDALATTLAIALNLDANSTSASSYVPFHHLPSRVPPNVHHLVLGETLRWDEYPPLYRKGTIASLFRAVTTIGLSNRFSSAFDLISTCMFDKRRLPLRNRTSPRAGKFKLYRFELSLPFLRPVMDASGDFMVNYPSFVPECPYCRIPAETPPGTGAEAREECWKRDNGNLHSISRPEEDRGGTSHPRVPTDAYIPPEGLFL